MSDMQKENIGPSESEEMQGMCGGTPPAAEIIINPGSDSSGENNDR